MKKTPQSFFWNNFETSAKRVELLKKVIWKEVWKELAKILQAEKRYLPIEKFGFYPRKKMPKPRKIKCPRQKILIELEFEYGSPY